MAVTEYLGMKPNEHEFKVMGLAPYAKGERVMKAKKVFDNLIWLKKIVYNLIQERICIIFFPILIKI